MSDASSPAEPMASLTPVLGSVLGQARRGNVLEETIARVLRGIRLGTFAPGEKLPPERELAESLGVSRSTLRDALAELQAAGYLSVRRGRYGGTFVAEELPAPATSLGAEDAAAVEDVLTFRGVVEPAAAVLAASATLSTAQRSALVQALEAVDAAEASQYRPLDARLHCLIAELSGSAMLSAAVAEARAAASGLLDRIPFLDTNIAHSQEQHQAIVSAILQGEPTRAGELMKEHLEGTASLLRGFLADEGPASRPQP
ncbi:FadR/GntR family transcriptional regulator [Nesterenkonia sp. HG001]|uniref:FadR/GntR family transcriptional regulator n=1 Tax=Nesterenkonia sp. HG001 TaxID=2983207 RepID=UPI002AC6B556|nr:GntR family transcriptional regulator [Nesterenkonia sp. HG001]MDZ5078305.1 GntR family transcriptional regulator [Nesterenkonia sp. HG001]